MIIFLTVLAGIFGVLQLMLFFKLWGMANNVARIKKHLKGGRTMDDLRKAILRGHKSEVEKLLTNIVIDELIDFKNDSSGYITTAGILSDYAKLAEKLGVTIPEGLGAFNTRDDIRGIV